MSTVTKGPLAGQEGALRAPLWDDASDLAAWLVALAIVRAKPAEHQAMLDRARAGLPRGGTEGLQLAALRTLAAIGENGEHRFATVVCLATKPGDALRLLAARLVVSHEVRAMLLADA